MLNTISLPIIICAERIIARKTVRRIKKIPRNTSLSGIQKTAVMRNAQTLIKTLSISYAQ